MVLNFPVSWKPVFRDCRDSAVGPGGRQMTEKWKLVRGGDCTHCIALRCGHLGCLNKKYIVKIAYIMLF